MILKRRHKNKTLKSEIEALRRRRKTGRLTFTYPGGYGDLYFKNGELIDANIDQLNGAGAVFLILTVSEVSCKFDPTIKSTRRTIFDSWETIVAEAQRQLNEGQLPSELFLQDDEFETAWSSLIEKPLSSVRRAAVAYQSGPGARYGFSAFASLFTGRFAKSGAWAVALSCVVLVTTVLTTVSIIALNRPLEERQPPTGAAEPIPQNTRAEQKSPSPAVAPGESSGNRIPAQNYPPIPGPISGGSGVLSVTESQVKPVPTSPSGGGEPTLAPSPTPDVKGQNAEAQPTMTGDEKEMTPPPPKQNDEPVAAQPNPTPAPDADEPVEDMDAVDDP
jgi:hypothetical protein